MRSRLACSTLTIAALCGACPTGSTTGDRSDTRGVISGRIQLSAVAGADDLSRVRVDLGRGEGGVPVDTDGSFSFSDLEPDTYALTVTYTGGLTDAASGSAYKPLALRVVVRAGSSASVGVLTPELGSAVVSGQFSRPDNGQLSGTLVRLVSDRQSYEAISADGTFSFPDVRVDRYRLHVTRDDLVGVCGREVVVGADAVAVTLPPEGLPNNDVTLGFGNDSGTPQVFTTEPARWFLRGDHVNVTVTAAPGTMGRAYIRGTTPPAMGALDNGFSFTGLAPDVEHLVDFEFTSACGDSLPSRTIGMVRDTQPPVAAALLNAGSGIARSPTMVLTVDAADQWSDVLEFRYQQCDDTVCTPAMLADAPWVPVVPALSVTFMDADGLKSVRMNVRDGSQNETPTFESSVLQASLDRSPPSDIKAFVGGVEVSGRVDVYAREVQVRVTATGATEVRTWLGGQSPGAGGWTGFVSGDVLGRDLGVASGNATLNIQLRDAVGNEATALAVDFNVVNSGGLTGTVSLAGSATSEGATVALTGTSFNATTDSMGGFLINDIPSGTYDVVVSASGYRSQRFLGVIIQPPVVRDIGVVTLETGGGRITGTVLLEGKAVHGGIEVQLPLESGETRTGITDGAGVFVLPVSPGTYNGDVVANGPTASVVNPRFGSASYTNALVVLQDQTVNVGELRLGGIANDVQGVVQVEGASDHAGVRVSITGLTGTSTESVQRVTTSDSSGAWRADALPFGAYSARFEVPGNDELQKAARTFTVSIGDTTVVPLITLARRFVLVEDGRAWSRDYSLALTLSNFPGCDHVEWSLSAGFTPATSIPCASTATINIPADSNPPVTGVPKTIYVRYFSTAEPGVPSDPVSDDIIVDSRAAVSAFTYSPSAPTSGFALNSLVTFRATTGETGGSATVSIAGYASGIALNDNGLDGDVTAGDGIYSFDYRLDVPRDVNAAAVNVSFVDFAGNTATLAATPATMKVAVPPLITSVRVATDTQIQQVAIAWDTDESATGRICYGPEAITSCPASGSVQPATGTRVAVTAAALTQSVTIDASALTSGNEYHFMIVARDAAGNESATLDRTFLLVPGTPTLVAAIPGQGRNWVRWEAPPQRNLQGFIIHRALAEEGPYAPLNSTPYTNEVNLYEDATVTDDVTYYYKVSTVDASGNESPPSEAFPATPGAPMGPTQVSGQFIRSVSNPRGVFVWSARGSPYIITGAVRTEADTLLVIGPGAEVRVDPSMSVEVHGRVAVLGARGTITTDGGVTTESDDGMVRIVSNKATPTASDWGGFRLVRDSNTPGGVLDLEGDVARYLSGPVLHRVHVQHAGAYAFSGDLGIQQTSAFYVAHSRFADLQGGVYVSARHMVVRNSTFRNVIGSSGEPVRTNSYLLLVENIDVSDGDSGGDFYVYSTSAGYTQPRGHGVLRNSTFQRLADGISASMSDDGRAMGPFHAVDLVFRDITRVAVRGGRSVSSTGNFYQGITINRSLFENVGTAVQAGTVSHSTIRGATTAAVAGFSRAYGCDIVDTHCTTTSCTNVVDVDARDQVFSNVISETTPGMRGSVLRNIGGAATADFRYNHILVPLAGFPAVRVVPGPFAFTGNSFLAPIASTDILMSTSVPYVLNGRINARANSWGSAATAEMIATPRGDISFIHDLFDDTSLIEVDYSQHVTGAYPMPRISTPWFGERFYAGDPVTLTGSATDPDEPASGLSLRWVSDTGTALGVGDTVTLTNPAVGEHTAWLVVTDSSLLESRIPVQFTVWPAP